MKICSVGLGDFSLWALHSHPSHWQTALSFPLEVAFRHLWSWVGGPVLHAACHHSWVGWVRWDHEWLLAAVWGSFIHAPPPLSVVKAHFNTCIGKINTSDSKEYSHKMNQSYSHYHSIKGLWRCMDASTHIMQKIKSDRGSDSLDGPCVIDYRLSCGWSGGGDWRDWRSGGEMNRLKRGKKASTSVRENHMTGTSI